MVTPIVLEGVPIEIRPACVVGSSPNAFADAVITLLAKAPKERRELAWRADIAAVTWERQLAPLEGLIQEAVRRHN